MFYFYVTLTVVILATRIWQVSLLSSHQAADLLAGYTCIIFVARLLFGWFWSPLHFVFFLSTFLSKTTNIQSTPINKTTINPSAINTSSINIPSINTSAINIHFCNQHTILQSTYQHFCNQQLWISTHFSIIHQISHVFKLPKTDVYFMWRHLTYSVEFWNIWKFRISQPIRYLCNGMFLRHIIKHFLKSNYNFFLFFRIQYQNWLIGNVTSALIESLQLIKFLAYDKFIYIY